MLLRSASGSVEKKAVHSSSAFSSDSVAEVPFNCCRAGVKAWLAVPLLFTHFANFYRPFESVAAAFTLFQWVFLISLMSFFPFVLQSLL